MEKSGYKKFLNSQTSPGIGRAPIDAAQPAPSQSIGVFGHSEQWPKKSILIADAAAYDNLINGTEFQPRKKSQKQETNPVNHPAIMRALTPKSVLLKESQREIIGKTLACSFGY